MGPWKALVPLVFLVASLSDAAAADKFRLSMGDDASYSLIIDGQVWLQSVPSYVFAENQQRSAANGSMKLVAPPRQVMGTDGWGDFKKLTYSYGFPDPELRGKTVNFYIKTYTHATFAIFGQEFPDLLDNTQATSGQVLSAFPAFHVAEGNILGSLTWAGEFTWMGVQVQRFGAHQIPDGATGGPLVLFDGLTNAIVISPASHFMAANMYHNASGHMISWGIMGGVNAVPAGFRYETILYYSGQGINSVMQEWGSVMRNFYKKDHNLRYEDPTIKHLGYYTDNGAYYYNMTEPGMNYEETILAVVQDARDKAIPYRYLQIDDWWYYVDYPPHDRYGSAHNWTWRPDVFPHGFPYLYNKTKLPVLAHNRYWSNKVTYAKQNGGDFDFLISGLLSLPTEQRFWDYLFNYGVQWGLAVYEQDFLDFMYDTIGELRSDLYLAATWLDQMGEAASRAGIRLQYCMALPRYLLHSLTIPSVTQARVSEDYADSVNQWQLGLTSILADAVGIAPSKDNFWTRPIMPGNRYNRTEQSPLLQAVIALLSTGPVAPSDKLHYSNAPLIKRLSTSSGLLLKPSKPATAIDAQIQQMAFNDSTGPVGQVYTTYSDISGFRFGIMLGAELQRDYTMDVTAAGFGPQFAESVVYSYKTDPGSSPRLPLFGYGEPLKLHNCSRVDFCLYYTAPTVMYSGNPFMIVGELSKLVPVSPARVQSISADSNDLQVSLAGSPGEEVDFYLYTEPATWWRFICVIDNGGSAEISTAKKQCTGLVNKDVQMIQKTLDEDIKSPVLKHFDPDQNRVIKL